jgi:hypothetical protein
MKEQVGRTPIEGIRELKRREQIAETRALHRRMTRRRGYLKMLAAAVLVNVALAWTLMIAVGVLHSEWWRAVPTMSYHAASLVTGLLFLGVTGTIVIIQTARDSS